jgi:metal-dependent amidase/aminoacylase/carboxypeptidase family protein
MEGTFRTMNEEWRNRAHQLIGDICQATFEHTGAWCEVDIVKGYPVLENHEEFTRRAIAYSKELWGKGAVQPLNIRMTAEDFAYYTREIPGVFYRLGVANKERGIDSPLHSSTFNIDEEAMITGMANMAWLAISFLKQG